MGGCCCLPKSELNRRPVHSYCHQVRVEHQLSSSSCGTESAISPGLLAHGNLDTSCPDTYCAPPAPLPYDINLVSSQTLLQTGSKVDQVPLNESQPLGENISGSNFEGCMNLESNHKKKSFSEHGSPKVAENKSTKFSVSVISSTEEEDVCPTCLEEYDADNPCIATKCNHHFHLSCILEWMERSDTCPICDQVNGAVPGQRRKWNITIPYKN